MTNDRKELNGFFEGDIVRIKKEYCESEKEHNTQFYIAELYEYEPQGQNKVLIKNAHSIENRPFGIQETLFLDMIERESDTTPDIVQCDWCNTGGNIYIFIGTFSDGTYFMLDSEFDVRILTEYPDWDNDDAWYEDWQLAHLVRDLNTETAGAAFVKKVFKFLRESGDKYIDSVKWIEQEAIELDGTRGWR